MKFSKKLLALLLAALACAALGLTPPSDSYQPIGG